MNCTLPNNLYLAFHCLYDRNRNSPAVNQELFIELNSLGEFLEYLIGLNYRFSLPGSFVNQERNCLISFDDGYFNNRLFVSLAESLRIPFIIFLSVYNIKSGKNFIWDIETLSSEKLSDWKKDYAQIYEKCQHESEIIRQECHRPFTVEELKEMSTSKYVHFGLHGYYHQPLNHFGSKYYLREVSLCKNFLEEKKIRFLNHFALPNGVATKKVMKQLHQDFEFIYTINPPIGNLSTKTISRFSIVNPEVFGSLERQIVQGNKPLRKLYNTMNSFKLAYL